MKTNSEAGRVILDRRKLNETDGALQTGKKNQGKREEF